ARSSELSGLCHQPAERAASFEPAPDRYAPVPIATAPDAHTVPVDRATRDGATRTLHLPHKPKVEEARNPKRRRPQLLAAGVGAALAVLIVVGIVASQRGQGHPAPSVPSTTPHTTPATPTSTRLPAALDDALRQPEK